MKDATNGHLAWPEEVIQFVEQKTSSSIKNLEALKLAGDASTRTFWRLRYGPKKWVLIQTDSFPNEGEKTDFINVHSYLKKCKVHVPEIYDFSPDLGLFLIEDLGNTLLSKSAKKLTPKQYAKYYFLALDELSKMHFGPKDPKCVAFTRAFDTKKYIWELEHTKNYLLNKHLHICLSDSDEKLLNTFFLQLSEHLSNQPKVFTHRDYHSRNLMIHQGKIFVIDFQDARIGTCHYDLASLVCDSYIKLPKILIQSLLDYYILEKEKHEQTKVDKEAFMKTFNWMCIQRNLKAMGTFAYLSIEKGKKEYLNFIKPAWTHVEEKIQPIPEFKEAYTFMKTYMEKLT